MGLLKETMQAIIRIDETISTSIAFWRMETMKKVANRENAVKEVPAEQKVDLRFAYPKYPSFDQRISAVQLFSGLSDSEFGAAVGLTGGKIYDLRRGNEESWPALCRALSRRFNIDETWLATGQLPQTGEEVAKVAALGIMTPLSGYENAKGIDWGDPQGSRTVVMTQDDLKRICAGKPLQTLQQMKEQVENITAVYSRNSQSENTSASDRPS